MRDRRANNGSTRTSRAQQGYSDIGFVEITATAGGHEDRKSLIALVSRL